MLVYVRHDTNAGLVQSGSSYCLESLLDYSLPNTGQKEALVQVCHSPCRSSFPEAIVEVGPELRLDDMASIRAFADTYRMQQRPLHVLINNAGANYVSEGVTANGIPLLTQVIRQLPPLLPPHEASCIATLQWHIQTPCLTAVCILQPL